MTIDKFGCHISKRYAGSADISSLENTIFSNVENKILNKFKNYAKYIENKIIQNFDHELKENINNLNKRVNEYNESVQNNAKKIKLIENDTIPKYDDNLENLKKIARENNDIINQFSQKIMKHDRELKASTEIFNEISNLEKNIKNDVDEVKLIIQDGTTTVNNVKNNLSKELTLRFETFSNILNDRVKSEVDHFKNVHDNIDNKIQTLDRSMKTHFIVHKNDNLKVTELNEKVNEIQNKFNLDISNIEDNFLKKLQSFNENIQTLIDIPKKELENQINQNSLTIQEHLIQLQEIYKIQKESDLKLKQLENEFLKKIQAQNDKIELSNETAKKDLSIQISTNSTNIDNIIRDVNDLETVYNQIKYKVTDLEKNIKKSEEKFVKKINLEVNDIDLNLKNLKKNEEKLFNEINSKVNDIDLSLKNLKKSEDKLIKEINLKVNDIDLNLKNVKESEEKLFKEINSKVNDIDLKNAENKLILDIKKLTTANDELKKTLKDLKNESIMTTNLLKEQIKLEMMELKKENKNLILTLENKISETINQLTQKFTVDKKPNIESDI